MTSASSALESLRGRQKTGGRGLFLNRSATESMSVWTPVRLGGELALLSHTWVHLTVFIIFSAPWWNSTAANTQATRQTNYPKWWKTGFFMCSAADSGAPSPQYLISDQSFTSEPVKGQVEAFDSTSGLVKLKNHKVCAWKRSIFSSLTCLNWHLTGMDSSFQCAPCLYTAIVCESATLSLPRMTLFIPAGVR